MHMKYGVSLTTWVLFIFDTWMCTSAMAGFAEIPANVTVELGTATPPCRCRHMTSDASIIWRVNGLPVARFPDIRSDSVNESGTIVDTLTIPAEPQYNGTVVECVAYFIDGSPTEVSSPATIFFTPMDSLPETAHFEMTSTNTPTGTHDIQNVLISSHIPGQVSVTGEFIQESMATGVLVTIANVNATYFEHHLFPRDDWNGIDDVISGLPGGQYTVSVFVVSKDGLPFERVATKPRRITVENAAGPAAVGGHPSPPIKYKLDQMSNSFCITCTFLDTSATDCVAVVHQRISQFNSSGLMNIKSSHKFNRSGDTAYGCIEGVNLEQYQVGVIDGKMITVKPKSKNRESLAGAIVGVLGGIVVAVIVTVTVIVAVVACTRLKRRRKTAAQPVYSPVTPRSGSQTHTIVNIESGSRAAVENDYAESAGLPEKPAEEQPLLSPPPLQHRVEDDGGTSPPGVSTPHVPGSADHGTHTLPIADNGADDPSGEEDTPPLPPRLDDSASVRESANQGTNASPHLVTSAGDPTYAPVLTTTPNTVSRPAATEKVSYEDIQKYQNGQGQHYALPQLKAAKKWPEDDLHQVEIKPHSITHDQTGDQNTDCTSDRPVTPPPITSHKTATVVVCEPVTTALDKMESSIDKQPAEESSDHEEQEVGSSDQTESSDSSVVIEMEDHEYESALDPPSGTQATITDNGNSENRTIEEELPMSCSSADQSCLKFHKNPEDQRNNDKLCKMSHWLCQDSHTHTNYNEALIRQMGLQVYQRVRDKLDINVVEDSALVHAGHEHLHEQVQNPSILSDKEQLNFNPWIKNCIPMTCTALAIPKVHMLFPLCPLKVPKYSISLVYLTIQVDRYNDHSVTLLFTCVILLGAYSSKLCVQ